MIGHAFTNNALQVLITGDLAFFYDRNAFWHNYALPNVRIIMLNNHGGAIFKMIDGPADLPEADEFFVTKQNLTAKHLCDEFGFEYIRLNNRRQIKNALKNFFEAGDCPKILELETTAELSKNIFDNFKNHIRKSYEL
jgi:2-succinyl-5-enolpyruvyl-6-hydroxy-3-cyclohexene-1-carboxylate synthase